MTERGWTVEERSRWGRVRLGGRRASAFWAALPIGIGLALVVGVVAATAGTTSKEPLVAGVVFALVTVWPCFGLAWILLVDRSTLQGATARPEESVEATWLDVATRGAFTDVLVLAGLGAAAIALTGAEISGLVVLCGVLVVAMGSVALRYMLAAQRG